MHESSIARLSRIATSSRRRMALVLLGCLLAIDGTTVSLAATGVYENVWPGTYTKSSYLYNTTGCNNGFAAQWWHYQNESLTGYSNSVTIHSVTGTGGGDTGLNSPLYLGASYVYDATSAWSASMPYPAKQHSVTNSNTVNQTFSLSYSTATFVDFWFGTLNGSDCGIISWVGLLKY